MAELPTTTIIGLEVHVQLRTQTKLFCGCSTKFGGPPNTQVCPVCLGLPGALPVMNEQAIELAIRAGLALQCDIPPMTKWDRKQYFYPDLPKGYQISQFDLPICVDGVLEIDDPADPEKHRKIHITRAHLEEDAGKSMHDETAGSADSRIDLNRCGTPLLEIVSEPDLRTADECLAYLTKLRETMVHLGVSDCEMQEGSLRVDANVNLEIDRHGEVIRTPIVEIKNMNSFRNVAAALDYEVKRQYVEWEDTGWTIKSKGKRTFGWDDVKEVTYPQREKEESADYRYFPCPDLLPVRIPRERVESIRQSLGETPGEARERLQKQYGIKAYDADVIVSQGREMVDYFDTVATHCGDGKRASSWIQQDVLRTLKERDENIDSFPVFAADLGNLLSRVAKGELPNDRARDVFKHLVEKGGTIDQAIEALGIEAVDESEMETLVKRLLDANPKVVEDVKSGNQKAIGPLIGQAKKHNPNANPQTVRQIALRLIEQAP
ncbi:Asp-tRNA(Asn)/Glu-tRNA(Gln) amidotransferase subunit GatB [Roseiconus lacunae]|uniref:Asp-tRNA(Asn)/Glu-tRNA(Gln) amidotransferase subunit GatB n=1 Tax=Roseiconus lacunae TaxID=2605694 RepID=UPI003093668C|nr:Asp-tRNA(Asn)/Glu-tRNA(Gln) amidotransferase subunit GatB [Stieleria sp. HD01]